MFIDADNHMGDSTGIGYGLFGVTQNANIKNVSVMNSYIRLSGYDSNVGSIVGSSCGMGEAFITTVDHCYSDTIFEINNGCVEGIVGNNYGNIINCEFGGSIAFKIGGGTSDGGGIAGYSYGTVADCINNGSLSSVNGIYMGGLLDTHPVEVRPDV